MTLPSEIYDRDYFLSDRVEGWERFSEDRGLSRVKQKQLRLLGPRPGLDVLDAGCGRGELLLACARAGAQVAGVDYADAAIEISRETLSGFPSADLRQADVTELPWPPESFDRILLGDVIEHLNPRDAAHALGELHRVLRPDGVLLVHTAPNRLFLDLAWPLARPLLLAAGRRDDVRAMDDWIVESADYHPNVHTLHGLRRAVRRAGFSSVRTWVDPDVLRGGEHRLTQGVAGTRLGRGLGAVATRRPCRLLLGNDLYALARR